MKLNNLKSNHQNRLTHALLFPSTSFLQVYEITEDDMIVMNVKRGHRRIIQREVATAKGIPRSQSLFINTIAPSTSFFNLPRKMSHLSTTDQPLEEPPLYLRSHSVSAPPPADNASGNASSSSGTTSAERSVRSNSTSGYASMSSNVPMSNSGSASGNRMSGSVMSEPRSNSFSSNDEDSTDAQLNSAPKRKYRRHPKPDKHAPIKPPSAYIMFSNDARAQLKDQNMSFAEIAKYVGDQWKNLSHSEKQAYERTAMQAKDEYQAALESYRQTPEYEKYRAYLKEFKQKQEAANRLIGRARKRMKRDSPSSGSLADCSSNGNGNGNGNGSSASGSADGYGEMGDQGCNSEGATADVSSNANSSNGSNGNDSNSGSGNDSNGGSDGVNDGSNDGNSNNYSNGSSGSNGEDNDKESRMQAPIPTHLTTTETPSAFRPRQMMDGNNSSEESMRPTSEASYVPGEKSAFQLLQRTNPDFPTRRTEGEYEVRGVPTPLHPSHLLGSTEFPSLQNSYSKCDGTPDGVADHNDAQRERTPLPQRRYPTRSQGSFPKLPYPNTLSESARLPSNPSSNHPSSS
ncbi:uncharacterized protein BYT42DRAFT_569468 [Radiomyces spectabilis]|uniref:uncharacterized protein n=1 Tax=Radiomyces spectabilis TaxID=64574 RepID=UPI00221ED81A|nr:uncharacterized protein BYT42DRAFT_569468 [Radiomyces spectabilis]KAI8379638.1 hypothetical protein BYT42DRAFT_569468 [Radiomyces spectabilis]